MKFLKILGILVAVFAVAGFLGTFAIESSARSQAKTYQIVHVTEESKLFGGVGEPIGTPHEYIISDPKAILPEKGENGVALLDDDYMKKHGIYPLQMQTVSSSMAMARIGSAVFAAIGGLIWYLTGRMPKKRAASANAA